MHFNPRRLDDSLRGFIKYGELACFSAKKDDATIGCGAIDGGETVDMVE